MTIQTTYSSARANLARLLDEIIDHRETVIIERRGKERVIMMAESEVSGLLETVHLLRSPKNAKRLLTALERALEGGGEPKTLEDLRREVGLDRKRA